MTNRDDKAQWAEMFDLQYDLCLEIDALIKAKFAKHPPLWRTIAQTYVIEHLAESARFDVVLPPATPPDNGASQSASKGATDG